MSIALRSTLMLLLIAAVLLPAAPPVGAPVETGAANIGSVADPPPAFVRRDTFPPAPAELERLAALARTAPLFAARPAGTRLLAFPPVRARAGRNAAIDWRILGGTPGSTVTIRLGDAGGVLDSARIGVDGRGVSSGAFRVRPERPGWHAWTVRAAGGGEVSAGAWVLPADTLRILVAGVTGSLEDREVARALERARADVTLAAGLGRGLTLGDAPGGLPALEADLRGHDAVVILAGVTVDSPRAAALRAFIAGGGGVAVVGAAAASLIPGIEVAPPGQEPAATLRWSAPAEIEPLPALEADVRVTALQANDGAPPAALLGAAPVLRLGSFGRGRWAALGLTETWRWGLEAGRTDDLARFWASLAGWLAGGAASDIGIVVDPASAPPDLPVDVHLTLLDSTAVRPERILLRTDGRTDPAAVAWTGERGIARFTSPAAGAVEILLAADGPVVAGHLADPTATAAPDAWARLGRIAAASGGALLPADSLETRMPSAGGSRIRLVLVLLAAGIAVAEWTRRRLAGRA